MIRSLLRRLWAPVRLWLYRQSTFGDHLGISIVDISAGKRVTTEFLRRTKEALDLIKRSDRRRFGRVQRELKYIVNMEIAYAAARYSERPPECGIDFHAMLHHNRRRSPEWSRADLLVYAGLIVHEATHGEIARRGIRHTKQNKVRIERLCDLEAARFLRRIDPKAGDLWEEMLAKSGCPADLERMKTRSNWRSLVEVWRKRRAVMEPTNTTVHPTRHPK